MFIPHQNDELVGFDRDVTTKKWWISGLVIVIDI